MDKLQLFNNLVNMASLDDKFTDQEIEFLVSRAERWGIPNDEFETILVGIHEQGPTFEIPAAQSDRQTLLEEMIRMMAADGELAAVEKELLATVSGKMEFSADEFKLILEGVIAGR
ncbi:MAG: TerB family tellurite resistance protein [Pirellulaceae bacterium]|nr:TerB family tellurite resistance protein [Pirellulaceae bacterium]